MLNGAVDPGFNDLYASLRHRLVMSTAYFGFDRAMHLPPNLICTGPVFDDDLTVLQERLESLDPDLNLWLNQAAAANEPVIYISLGSQVRWQPWYIDTFYEALLALYEQQSLRVVIALTSQRVHLPENYDRQMFWVDEWLP